MQNLPSAMDTKGVLVKKKKIFTLILLPQVEVLHQASVMTFEPVAFTVKGKSISGIGLQANKVRTVAEFLTGKTCKNCDGSFNTEFYQSR